MEIVFFFLSFLGWNDGIIYNIYSMYNVWYAIIHHINHNIYLYIRINHFILLRSLSSDNFPAGLWSFSACFSEFVLSFYLLEGLLSSVSPLLCFGAFSTCHPHPERQTWLQAWETCLLPSEGRVAGQKKETGHHWPRISQRWISHLVKHLLQAVQKTKGLDR